MGFLSNPTSLLRLCYVVLSLGGGGGVLNLRLKLGNNKFMDQKLYKFQIKVGYQ